MLRTVILDASAYRALVRDLDLVAARQLARALADAERAHDLRAVASPFALWSLLADAAIIVTERTGRRGPSEVDHARAGRARLAVACCVAHTLKDRGTAGRHPFVLGEDPDTRLCHAVGFAPPPGLAAWNEYLASLAAELGAEPTAEQTQKLATPLRHVAERAAQTGEDFADEMQDAVLAAYDAASSQFGWTDATPDDVRRRALLDPLGTLPNDSAGAARGGADDEDDDRAAVSLDDALMAAVLARDPLLRAVASGRASRAKRFVTATRADEPLPEASVVEAARVVPRFPSGASVARELLRRVIAGDVEVAGRAARRWLWDLNTVFPCDAATAERGVTGSGALTAALGADARAIEPLAGHRASLGI